MDDEALKWTVSAEKLLLRTPVFEVWEQAEQAAEGLQGSYVAMRAPDWVMVIPVLGKDFLMVRQWRHAARCMTVEFPGGVRDGDEDRRSLPIPSTAIWLRSWRPPVSSIWTRTSCSAMNDTPLTRSWRTLAVPCIPTP